MCQLKKCYVHPDFSNRNLLNIFLKESIPIFVDSDRVEGKEDVVICLDDRIDEAEEVLNWNNIFTFFWEYTEKCYRDNYDGYYLKNAIWEAQQKEIDTLIVGSSYPQKGIIEENLQFGRAKNLALSSQDYFYSVKLAEIVLNANPQIKRILFGGGYYTIFCDISRTMQTGGQLISNVYYPITGDLHHTIILPERVVPMESSIYDVKVVVDFLSGEIYRRNGRTYFNKNHGRRENRNIWWKNSEKLWCEISGTERFEAAAKPVESHNRLLKHKASYQENTMLLNEFALMCEKRGMEMWMLLFPASEEYNKQLNPELKKSFYEAVNRIRGTVHIIDFNECEMFERNDFDDPDHLNERGAEKVTDMLDKVIIKEVGS